MESNIKGLVAAGYEMASELKAECGAVDMRSVAKLISDLATQLEVQLVRANALAEDQQKAIESIKQADSAVKLAHEKFSALAAENAGLKAFKTAVYQQMGVGCDAPEFSITVGLSNLRRFADTLHAIEREFFTKERLLTIKQWRETYGPGSNVVLPAEEAEELARIALASLEAEPVAWMRDDADGREYNARNEFSGGGGGVPLYATPPVPVVPEEKPMPNPLSMYAVDAVAAIAEVRGWNACRAAMLQGKGE